MITLFHILSTFTHYDGSPTAHADVIKALQPKKQYKMSDAWCVLQIMAVFYQNGALDMIGGLNRRSKELREDADAMGIWHEGSSGILPGDIVVYADKKGVPEHSEFAIGANLNISGNYNGGTSRRTRSGRRIAGYVRPKYAPMPDMDDLQITIAAVDVLLNVYGTNNTRVKQLSVFGRENASRIQQEVDKLVADESEKIFAMAVYVIAGHAGKDDYRKKRLGNYYEKIRKQVNAIYDMRGKSIDQAAADVIADKYKKNETRKLLLKFCGYDPQKVQDKVNEIMKAKPQKPAEDQKKAEAGQKIHSASLISIFADADRSKKSIDGLQGDSFVMIADQPNKKKKAIVLDTARYRAKKKIYKELEGVDDAVLVITHPHSDHMGQTANDLVNDRKVSHVYLPNRATIAATYLARYDALVKACSKAKIPVTQLRQGDSFKFGGITAKVVFQQSNASTDSVNMRSLCLLFEIAGATFLDCGDHHVGTKESKLDVSQIGPVTIYDSSHHGLYTGDKDKAIKILKPQWIIHSGWKSWPLGSIGSAEGDKAKQDPKTRAAQIVYQKYGNLIPGDICGRTELRITDGVVDAVLEKNAKQTTVKYKLNGATHTKTVTTCKKAAFKKVRSMIPAGAEFV